MRKGILVASLALWVSLALSGFALPAGTETPSRDTTDMEIGPAQAALAAAQAAVEAAAEHRALWTTAQLALAQARAALEEGDYKAARRLAEFAAEQARLGIAQMTYRQFQ